MKQKFSDLEEEVEGGLEEFRGRLTDRESQLREDLERRLELFESDSGYVLNTGSNHPERLTTVRDPKVLDRWYPHDFDFCVVAYGEPGEEKKEEILEALSEGRGQVSKGTWYNSVTSRFFEEMYPVNIVVFSEEEAGKIPVIEYSRKHASFGKDQLRHIRAVKLWAMRIGAYGGFTKGMPGIAAEQLVAQTGGFGEAMELLSEENPILDSPVGYKKNLLEGVQKGILRRVAKEAQEYVQSGLVRSEPFGMQYWQETHQGSSNRWSEFKTSDVELAFGKASQYLRGSAKHQAEQKHVEVPEHEVLVVPYNTSNEAFLSVKADGRLADDIYSAADGQFKSNDQRFKLDYGGSLRKEP